MTATAVRVPQITREKTSNPDTVVPQILVEDGGCWVPKEPNSAEVCAHVYGAINGAKSAVIKTPMVMIKPAISIARCRPAERIDRKSTRLNSSHVSISYAVFCL